MGDWGLGTGRVTERDWRSQSPSPQFQAPSPQAPVAVLPLSHLVNRRRAAAQCRADQRALLPPIRPPRPAAAAVDPPTIIAVFFQSRCGARSTTRVDPSRRGVTNVVSPRVTVD